MSEFFFWRGGREGGKSLYYCRTYYKAVRVGGGE
jgi:hypothetical protein